MFNCDKRIIVKSQIVGENLGGCRLYAKVVSDFFNLANLFFNIGKQTRTILFVIHRIGTEGKMYVISIPDDMLNNLILLGCEAVKRVNVYRFSLEKPIIKQCNIQSIKVIIRIKILFSQNRRIGRVN